jgi:hypothetical protein
MLNRERRTSVALLKLKVVTTGPGAPRVVHDELQNLHPGDRLTFVQDGPSPSTPGPPVYVNLSNTLVALVKFKGTPSFLVNMQSDGSAIVTLLPDSGNGPPTDPP